MLTKPILLKILNSYVYPWWDILKITKKSEKILRLERFANSLNMDELSLPQLGTLENILLAPDESNDDETTRICEVIKNILKERKEKQTYIASIFQQVFSTWTHTHYFIRVESLLNALREITPQHFAQNQNLNIRNVTTALEHPVAIAYLAMSLYLTSSPYSFITGSVTGRLSHTVGQSMIDFIPVEKIQKFKPLLSWFLGLCLQSIAFSTENKSFLISGYCVGTLLEQAASYGFNKLQATKRLAPYKQHYPMSVIFLEQVLRDIAFSAGYFINYKIHNRSYKVVTDNTAISTRKLDEKHLETNTKQWNSQNIKKEEDISKFFTPTHHDINANTNPCKIEGSYQKTCTHHENLIASDDSNIGPLCEITMECEKLDTSKEKSMIYIPPEAINCVHTLENCDGKLIERKNGRDVCNTSDPKAIKEMATTHSKNSIFSEKNTCDFTFTGSHDKTCEMKSQKYQPKKDPKLSGKNLCEITFECKELDGKPRITKFFSSSQMVNCLVQTTENCNGTPVFRSNGKDNLCVAPAEAIKHQQIVLSKRK